MIKLLDDGDGFWVLETEDPDERMILSTEELRQLYHMLLVEFAVS